MSDMVGQTIDRYHVVEKLGEGGMAAVYKAFDTRLERHVALKIILHGYQASGQFLKRFEREARALARLSHPNIVKVHDYGEHNGTPYLVMEYLPGGTLKEKLGTPLDPAAAARLLVPLGRALGYAHSQKVVHRDVKPANVLITASGEPMLSDFGIARIMEADETQGLTGTGVGIGTPEYMAPEQGMGEAVDHRADIYALGVMFYEMVTGRRPYQADTPMAVMLKKIREPLPNPRRFVPQLSQEVEGVILKALAKDPANRFQDMDSFAAALAALETSTAARHVTPPQEVGVQPAGRRPAKGSLSAGLWIGLGLAAVVVLVGVLLAASDVFSALFGEEPGASAPLAVEPTLTPPLVEPPNTPPAAAVELSTTATPFTTPTPQIPPVPALQPGQPITPDNIDRLVLLRRWGKGTLENVAYSPDGTQLAVASSRGVFLYDPATLDETGVIETGFAVAEAVFSADGALLAVSEDSGYSLQIWDANSGALVRTMAKAEGVRGFVGQLAFSPDGRLVAAALSDQVAIWSAETGELSFLLEGFQMFIRGVAFSPDGRILATGDYGGNRVILWDTDDGSQIDIIETEDRVSGLVFSPDGAILAVSSFGDVNLWDLGSRTQLANLDATNFDSRMLIDGAETLTFSPDGAFLATGTDHNLVRLWNVENGALLRTLEGHDAIVNSLAFSPGGERLVSASADKTMRLWQVDNGETLASAGGFSSPLNSVDFSPDGKLLALGSEDGVVRLQRVVDGEVVVELPGHASVECAAFSPDGTLLASGDADGVLRIWQVESGTLLHTMDEDLYMVNNLAFSPDGALLGAAISAHVNDADRVYIWETAGGSLAAALEGHTDDVNGVAFSPDGALLASGSSDTVMRLWDTGSWSLVREIPSQNDGRVNDVIFSPDGSILTARTSASGAGIQLWDTGAWAYLEPQEKLYISVGKLAFSPDGMLLVAGANILRVGDSGMDGFGRRLWELEGHTGLVQDAAFSPDASLLVTVSWDGTVVFWGVEESAAGEAQ